MKMESLKKIPKAKNPRKDASYFSKLTFWYMNKFFSKGHKENLDLSDLFETLTSLSSVKVTTDLKRKLQKDRRKKHVDHEPNAFICFAKAHMASIILLGFGQLLSEASHVVNAYLVGYLIDYFNIGAQGGDKTNIIIYATVIAVLTALNGICHHTIDNGLACLGLKLRTAVSSLIYEKVTRLSQGAFANTSAGNVINLFSSDAQKFISVVFFFNYFWIMPVKLLTVFVLLYLTIGISSIPGMALLLLFIPFQTFLGKVFAKLRIKVGGLTDERVKITSEVIKGMRGIKMYTWEEPFCRIIQESRRKEIWMIFKTQLVRAVNTTIFICMPYLCAALMFTTHYLRGKPLTTTTVFSTLALLQLVRYSLCIFFPLAVQVMAESLMSFKRVATFLNLDEKVCTNLTLQSLSQEDPLPYVTLTNVNASWKSDEDDLTLTNINIHVDKENPLLIIVGAVGSGKTSILMSICGEIPIMNGNIQVNGKIAYASQLPWIFSGTVRQNILFGQPFDDDKYDAVVNACALKKDFEQLSDGDMTLVGERGVCVSGGQKARISLARAVYRDADIYLLDDPLSAVDSKVGNHIFEQCICGLLKDKLRILVTHQTQYLKSASHILCIEKGEQIGYGQHDEISESNSDVLSIISETSVQFESSPNVSSENVDLVLAESRTRRRSSVISQFSIKDPEKFDLRTENGEKEDDDQVQNEETINQGKLGLSLYLQYFLAGGGIFLTLLMFFVCILAQLSLTGVDWWIGQWSNAEEAKLRNATVMLQTFKYYFHDNPDNNLYMYLGWIGFTCILVFTSVAFFFYIIVNSSKNLHNRMLSAILKAPMYFFDTTQSGIILNRFAKDIFFLDDELPWTFQEFWLFSLFTLNAIVISCMNIPYLVLIIILLLMAFLYLRSYYLVTARKVKRLEGISRSPMFSHFSETLEGLPTIRALQAVDVVIKEFYDCQDLQSDGWYLFLNTIRWFGIRLDMIVTVFIFCAIYAPIIATEFTNVDPTLAGLSLVYALQLCIYFQWCVRQSAQVENYMTSAERVFEYCRLKAEPDVKTNTSVPSDWPRSGKIEATQASFAYHDTLPKVLDELEFCINSGEKIGIIGRTGAGKSSMFSAMFRTGLVSGDFSLDGVTNNCVSLHDWRKNLSIIPQDPVLFSGSLRINIDPFSEFKDAEIWDVLELVQLKDDIAERPQGLISQVSEGGSNFSVGQRQLLCLARALLLKKKILLMDEATANVDKETDSLIQATIREKFCDSTVITVAHRLNTVMDCDRIMVLDAGRIVQFDEPCKLFTDKDGIFYKLVQETGKETIDELKMIASKTKSNQVKRK